MLIRLSTFFSRLIACLGIAATLFAQLAVAAYDCPPDRAPGAMMAESAHAAMPDCAGHAPAYPNLCVQHCQYDSRSVQSTQPLTVPQAAPMCHWTIPEPPVATRLTAAVAAFDVDARQTAPPPLVRFQFLRI